MFEKTNNICVVTKRGNWKKGTWGKVFLKKKDIKVKNGEVIKGEYLKAKKQAKSVNIKKCQGYSLGKTIFKNISGNTYITNENRNFCFRNTIEKPKW